MEFYVDEIPSVEIRVSDIPSQPREFSDDVIKFSNITAKTPRRTIRNFTVIDVETTGLSEEKAEILEIAAIRFRNGEPVKKFHTLTAPTKSIPARITKINGITNNMVKGCPHFSLIAESLLEFIGDDNIVGHNLEFDLRFIMRHGVNITIKKRKYYDTLTLAQRILKKPQRKWNRELGEYEIDYDDYDVENYKLGTLCDYYRIEIPTAHRADGDSFATGFLFMELGDERIVDDYYLPKKAVPANTSFSGSAIESAVTEPKRQYRLVSSNELQSLTKREFKDYLECFNEYVNSLPPDVDSFIREEVSAQVALIQKEAERRSQKSPTGGKIKVLLLTVCWLFVIGMILYAIASKFA